MRILLRLGKAQLAQNKKSAANKSFETAARWGKRHRSKLGAGLYFAAEARFLQADEALAQFEAIQIAGSPEGLGKRLTQKAERLAKAAGLYAQVVEFGVAEWVTAALFKIGRSYELFASEVIPHFRRRNVARQASLQFAQDNSEVLIGNLVGAITKAYTDYYGPPTDLPATPAPANELNTAGARA